MSTLIFKKKIGFRVEKTHIISLFGKQIPIKTFFGATYPFGKIKVYDDKIVLLKFFSSMEIKKENMKIFEQKIWEFGKFNHRIMIINIKANKDKCFYIYDFSTSNLIKELNQAGYAVEKDYE
ncbi:MAG: hypothetical protein WC393_00455 [Candidatus Nanoarchaeia archaeon]